MSKNKNSRREELRKGIEGINDKLLNNPHTSPYQEKKKLNKDKQRYTKELLVIANNDINEVVRILNTQNVSKKEIEDIYNRLDEDFRAMRMVSEIGFFDVLRTDIQNYKMKYKFHKQYLVLQRLVENIEDKKAFSKYSQKLCKLNEVLTQKKEINENLSDLITHSYKKYKKEEGIILSELEKYRSNLEEAKKYGTISLEGFKKVISKISKDAIQKIEKLNERSIIIKTKDKSLLKYNNAIKAHALKAQTHINHEEQMILLNSDPQQPQLIQKLELLQKKEKDDLMYIDVQKRIKDASIDISANFKKFAEDHQTQIENGRISKEKYIYDMNKKYEDSQKQLINAQFTSQSTFVRSTLSVDKYKKEKLEKLKTERNNELKKLYSAREEREKDFGEAFDKINKAKKKELPNSKKEVQNMIKMLSQKVEKHTMDPRRTFIKLKNTTLEKLKNIIRKKPKNTNSRNF